MKKEVRATNLDEEAVRWRGMYEGLREGRES